MRNFLICLVIAAFPASAIAQNNCDNLIRYDTNSIKSDIVAGMSFLNTVSREDYESDQEGIRTSLQIPIEGIIVGGEGDWDKFEEKRSKLNTLLKWEFNFQGSEEISLNYVTAGSWDAVIACLRNVNGLHLALTEVANDHVDAIVMYRGPSSGASTIGLNWSISGGTVVQSVSKIDRGDEDILPVEWAANQDLSIVVSGGGLRSNKLVLRRAPKVVTPPPALEVAYCVGKGDQRDVRLWGPKGANCNGLPPKSGWGKYDGNPQKVAQLGSCKGHGAFRGVTLWGPVGEPCGATDGTWGTYGNPVSVSNSGIANCVGHGNILNGHLLWGPTGLACGGIRAWGTYAN